MEMLHPLVIPAATGNELARTIFALQQKDWREPPTPCLEAAFESLGWGWSIVPQMPGAKMPLVKWKPFQERRPTENELRSWFESWPNAGLAVVLGQVSDLLVIDVDGEEAHDALLARLGQIPCAPMAVSGSGKPFRYHLYFRHPDVPTKAKATP